MARSSGKPKSRGGGQSTQRINRGAGMAANEASRRFTEDLNSRLPADWADKRPETLNNRNFSISNFNGMAQRQGGGAANNPAVYNQAVQRNVTGQQQNYARSGGAQNFANAGAGANDAYSYAGQTQANYAQNTASNGNSGDPNNNNGNGGNDTTPPYQGMFAFNEVMNNFYESNPSSEVGQAIKGTFASNLIQGAADHLQAKDMAYTQQGIALTNMKAAANLEKENNAYMMADEYRYGLGTMDAQYNYTNNFANAQYDRDIGMLSAKGVDTRKTQDNASKNAMQEMVTAGQQQRLNTQLQGTFDVTRSNIAANAAKHSADAQKESSMYGSDRAAQASMYGSQKDAESQMYSSKQSADASRYSSDRNAEASKYSAAQARDASMYGSDRTAQASMYGAAQTRDASMYGSDRTAQASMYGAAAARDASMYGSDKQLEGIKDTNVTSTRNIRATGDETRRTNAQTNQFQVDKENREQSRSRAGARRY